MSKRYAVYVAVVNEEGEAVITRSVGGYNDLYTLPEANRIITWRGRSDLVDIEFAHALDRTPQPRSVKRGLTFPQAWLIIGIVVTLFLVWK